MIDIKLIRENRDLVKENIKKKFQDEKLPLVDEVYELDKRVREVQVKVDGLKATKNKLSGQIGILMKDGKKDEANKIKEDIKNNSSEIAKLEEEQVELNKKQIENEVKYLKEGLEVILIFFEGEMLGIELPEKIDFVITKTEPGIKGNTATNATKDAIIETGMLVKVPLFIEQGEEIIVSTKDGKYVSRK